MFYCLKSFDTFVLYRFDIRMEETLSDKSINSLHKIIIFHLLYVLYVFLLIISSAKCDSLIIICSCFSKNSKKKKQKQKKAFILGEV